MSCVAYKYKEGLSSFHEKFSNSLENYEFMESEADLLVKYLSTIATAIDNEQEQEDVNGICEDFNIAVENFYKVFQGILIKFF